MYFETLAKELLAIHGKLLRVPASQKLSKMLHGEHFVLYYLNEHGGFAHPKNLSENLAVSTARIARLLNNMEKKQLIKRLDDPEDSRQVIVTLTPQGLEAIGQAKLDVLLSVAEMLEMLGPDDAREYVRLQEKIYQNFSKSTSVS